MRERSICSSDWVVERDVDFNLFRDKILDGLRSVQLVARLGVVGRRHNHACPEYSQRLYDVNSYDSNDGSSNGSISHRDAIVLANAKYTRVNVGRSCMLAWLQLHV